MPTRYIYIDESGDLGEKGSKCMVLAELFVDDSRQLDRIIKNMRRNKFKKELRKAMEIKADKSSGAVRRHMLEKLNDIKGAKIFYIVLEKKKLFSKFLKNDKHKLYNYVAGKLARNITLDEMELHIRIDKSKGKQILREDFNDYFEKRLKEKSSSLRVKIDHSYSHSWSGLQFADILAWSCFQKFEHNNNEYIDLIKLEQEVYHVW